LKAKFQTHQVALSPEWAGRRLDQVLAQLLPQYSRTRIQRWIEDGAVRVDGLAARARDVVVGGDRRGAPAGRNRHGGAEAAARHRA
jgi:23S rRNA-/tRNA-specific pseudouridylate synthase